MTRTAISPRLAIRIFLNMDRPIYSLAHDTTLMPVKKVVSGV
jgi:hypothetical protein